MFSPYPSTEQFRNVIKKIKGVTKDTDLELPTLKFIGTIKLHGSNAAIGYQKDTVHWCQSRNNVITPTKDFEAFAKTLAPVADQFLLELILPQCPAIREYYELGKQIVIYGEWCGGKIQKNVAIFGLPKMFVIFNVRIVDIESENAESDEADDCVGDDDQPKSAFWLHPKDWSNVRWHEKSIYNIYDFPTYEMDINFQCPEVSQNHLIEITESVEEQCPVGKHFNRTGLGEGVVWTEWEQSNGRYTFKVKGAKHSVSNVTTLAAVDTEKCENLQNFIDYACTENRMQQGLDYMREQNVTIEMKNFAIFIKWIVGDIVKEEKDTMDASNIKSADVGRKVRDKVMPWFKKQIT